MRRTLVFAVISALAVLLAAEFPGLLAPDASPIPSSILQAFYGGKGPAMARAIAQSVPSLDPGAKPVRVKSTRHVQTELAVESRTEEDYAPVPEGKTDRSLPDLKAGTRVRLRYRHTDEKDNIRSAAIQPSRK